MEQLGAPHARCEWRAGTVWKHLYKFPASPMRPGGLDVDTGESKAHAHTKPGTWNSQRLEAAHTCTHAEADRRVVAHACSGTLVVNEK